MKRYTTLCDVFGEKKVMYLAKKQHCAMLIFVVFTFFEKKQPQNKNTGSVCLESQPRELRLFVVVLLFVIVVVYVVVVVVSVCCCYCGLLLFIVLLCCYVFLTISSQFEFARTTSRSEMQLIDLPRIFPEIELKIK